MSAICLLMKLNLGNKDYEVFDKIRQLMKECDDIDHKKQNVDDNKDENIINKSTSIDKMNELIINSNFEEYLNMIYNRGKDNFEVFTVNKNNNVLQDFKEKAQKMKYNELFDFLINTNNKIIINTFLNLFNDNNTNEFIFDDSETNNILQFNGEIYNNIDGTVIDNYDKKTSFFKLLNSFSKENKIEDLNKYIENFFKLYNNLESDHSFYFHDNINKQIVISRDLFGKRSIILYYIKSLSIIIFTPILSDTLINLYKSNQNDIINMKIQ